ncbi:Uncharacterised protein [Arachnia propionica]|uniref:Uncharacterized protein n=1 Tax=Arachnia propionica TaxID=1750 RepID=A0A3S4UGU7_9ACTN|nr:Uncharacterised protein [Arachnia propionica]
MAGTMLGNKIRKPGVRKVSMESGLDGRNNGLCDVDKDVTPEVSMESGLDGRNN